MANPVEIEFDRGVVGIVQAVDKPIAATKMMVMEFNIFVTRNRVNVEVKSISS